MRCVLLGGVVVLSLALSGCAMFRSACNKAMPVLVKSQSLAFEAQAALNEASAAINESSLPAEQKAKAVEAISAAQAGLQAAGASLAALSNACTEPDLSIVFEGFLSAWDVIRRFLSLVGGEAGVRDVEDPTIYSMTRG